MARPWAPGTYMGQFLSVQAALTTLEILERDNGAAYVAMEKLEQCLMSGLDEMTRRRGISARVQGITGAFGLVFGASPDKTLRTLADVQCRDNAISQRFWLEMKEQGIRVCPERWFISIAHTAHGVDIALEAAEKAMGRLQVELASDTRKN